MKHIVALISILLFSQMADSQKDNETYEVLWKQVEKLESDALTKSALKVVQTISVKAKKENNAPQNVKALLYSSKYAMTLEEDAQLKIINDFKSEIESAQFPTKNVLQSYLANLYWRYFQQNRYRFYNRTNTSVKVDTVDFRTWDLTTIFEEISTYFDASLSNESKLKSTPVSVIDPILNQQKDTHEYRPTLYDLLAHNALNFYKTSENNITRPAEIFEVNSADFLCNAEAFVRKNIDTSDKTSLQVKALCIYQSLIALHLDSPEPYTLAEINLERLNYTYEHATFDTKAKQFVVVLQNEATAAKESLAEGVYQFQLASFLNQQGNQYQPDSNEEHRWKKKEALALCETVIEKYPNSRSAEQCKALKTQILQTSLKLTSERHIPIGQDARLLVNYKNLNELQLSARRITKKQTETLNSLYERKEIFSLIKKLPIATTWEASLKNENDYQTHQTEIILPPLENGEYLLLAEIKDNSNTTYAYSAVQSTTMALIESRTKTHQHFQVIRRNNGMPIAGAKMELSYQKNYERGRLRKSFTTDAMGLVKIPLTNENWNDVNITISHKGEEAYFENYYMSRKYGQSQNTPNYSCFLFTDRSIYRPGQPLYFKGIAVKQENGISTLLENENVSVELKDVNGQPIKTSAFTTNEYGSFSGEFILPNTGLTGQFSMQVKSDKLPLNGYINFSVEEYKRPKFETYFQPITESYKVNDSIMISGKAIAYAGSTITDAKVSYRVKRVVYYPRWCYWYYPNLSSSPQEIAHGETKTDASGLYHIDFKALPDSSVDRKNLPTFSYEVTADVTDINGETHSATTVVNVGYHTLTASLYIANPLDKNAKENKLTISTNNLNGEFVPAKGQVKMYKLQAPESVLRPRTWKAPDYKGWSKEEFKKRFPHDAFSNEHDPSTWTRGKLVWQSDFDTGKSREIPLGNTKKWPSGTYVLELETKDKFGQEVRDILQTNLFSQTDKTLADNQLFHIKTDKEEYVVGDTARITLLSNSQDLNVTVRVEKDHKIIDTKLIRLSNNASSITVPVNSDDLGGFAITYSFAAYNHFQSGSVTIQVPYPSSQLQIETLTFRDKIQPGTDETWSFKIKGPKGDKVAAELLANMYDASLDVFRSHYWRFNPLIQPRYYTNQTAQGNNCFMTTTFNTYLDNKSYSYRSLSFDTFNWFGLYFGINIRIRGYASGISRSMMKNEDSSAAAEMQMEGVETDMVFLSENREAPSQPAPKQGTVSGNSDANQPVTNTSDDIKIRKNLRENAFFLPQLQTDKNSNVSFSFTTPEALTKWNLQLLAHTKNLESTYTSMQTVTQKELMVIPNAPRFLREGDDIVISTKIANLTEKALSGHATLELVDAISGKKITNRLLSSPPSEKLEGTRAFSVDSLGNTQVSWQLHIPDGIQAVQYTVSAKAGDFSDGEQNLLPVLTNRMLVTETMPMWVRSNETKTFTLEKLRTLNSPTLKHHKLTLEMTSNPAWYAIQALPYLMEYPYECNEQTFSKFYANTLASHIANANPRIREVFDQWADSDALVSNLEKNQELKSLLIQETPWLRDAQSETEQKKRIALLFNMNNMKNEQAIALRKLKQNQKESGAWPWFNGGPDNRYITQHIISGLGHLKRLNVTLNTDNSVIIQKAIDYLDAEFVKEYEYMKKHTKNLKNDHLSRTQIHYLYMRSFFKDIKTTKKVDNIIAYYNEQAQKYWKDKALYSQGMLALVMHRMDETATADKILRALKENSISSEELGMYWKENTSSWYWYQAPIETQALLIEAFSEIHPKDIETIDNLKIWLLKNKQTNQWKTTKATTEAVYALLLQGSDWLSVTDAVDVLVGGEKIEPSKLENVKVEAGTGYYKTAWNGSEVQPKMAEVQISKKGDGIAWGALYWQYFEDLDKISSAETPLKLKKKLFLKKNTDTGEVLSEITDKTALNVGDLVKVRIELRADRPMEFVHMKDMRAAGFEPVNVISRYQWQDGLGYYESTKDASTNFFFDYLPKGVFVFEYDLRVNNKGDFSNGIATIQSMYAPEFTSHSNGLRVQVGSN